MTDRLEIRSVRPHDLIPNPLNAEIYDSTPTPDLIESIRQHGIIEPLVATLLAIALLDQILTWAGWLGLAL
ncbi:MAG: hypothetical protein ACNA8P_08185, partial [Phycisphaerales bacterium]